MFSRSKSTNSGGTVEKNIADIKLWIPAKMKADIQALAKKAGKKPSTYVREVIISQLYGHIPPEGISLETIAPEECDEDAF